MNPRVRLRSEIPLKDILFSFSLANLFFVRVWYLLFVHARKANNYFQKEPPPTNHFVALIIDMFLLAAVIWCGKTLLKRLQTEPLRLLGIWIFFVGLWIPLGSVCKILSWNGIHWMHYLDLDYLSSECNPYAAALAISFSCAITLALLVRCREAVFNGLRAFVIIMFPLFLMTLAQAVWYPCVNLANLTREETKIRSATHLSPNEPTEIPRVLWLLFDEMDYEKAFLMRPGNNCIPAISQFAQESFCATQAFPPAGTTLKSMPSLFTGRKVSAASAIGTDVLMITYAGEQASHKWKQQVNVFSETKKLGGTTRLYGWYHPYGRILGQDLDECFWLSGQAYPVLSLSGTMVKYFGALKNNNFLPDSPLASKQHHIELFNQIHDAALQAISEIPPGLTFIHFPVPHPPYIYDRSKESISSSSTPEYFDNLTLADRTFGELRSGMVKSGSWKNTIIILTSDHWSKDKEKGNSQWDRRVPFIIKMNSPAKAIAYEKPFNTVVTKDLILALLRREIANYDDLSAWLDTHGGNWEPV